MTASFVRRAEAAGYGAIVVHARHAAAGLAPARPAGRLLPFLKSVGIANYLADPVFRDARWNVRRRRTRRGAVGHFVGQFSNPAATWAGIDKLRALTELPLILKGVNHPDDAREAR